MVLAGYARCSNAASAADPGPLLDLEAAGRGPHDLLEVRPERARGTLTCCCDRCRLCATGVQPDNGGRDGEGAGRGGDEGLAELAIHG